MAFQQLETRAAVVPTFEQEAQALTKAAIHPQEFLSSHQVIAAATFFSVLGCALALYQILCHLRNYTEPVFQRYIIRIIFMVPVYAVGSLCSLKYRDHSIYFDTARDCYEAWIIYNFSSLLLAYVGGPGAVVVKAEGKQVHPSWGHMTCCLPTMQVDGFFLRRCKQGTLQFVLLKPLMALVTVILYAAGAYTEGDMSPDNGYFYISILYNISYTLALYGLLLFWIGASELLQPFNPLLKFIIVKSVVFLTFWQGIGISYINSMGEFTDPEEGEALQNFLICVEMAVAGTGMLFAFPYKEYQMGGATNTFRFDAFMHAISIRDVVVDTIHVFALSYSDYVLYTDGGPADNVKRKKYRGQKGGTSEHPKAGLLKNMEKGVMADDDEEPLGRRSKTPDGVHHKKMEAHRKQAILLDSDSDAMDSDDDGSHIGAGVATDSDDDKAHHTYSRTAASITRDDASDGEAQQQPGVSSGSRKPSRKYRSRNSRSKRRTTDNPDEADSVPAEIQAARANSNSNEGTGQRRTRSNRPSGIGSLPPLPLLPMAGRPQAANAIVTAAQVKLLLGGPILADSDDEGGNMQDAAELHSEPSMNDMAHGPAAANIGAVGRQHEGADDAGDKAQAVTGVRSSAAGIMKQVSSKALAAANRMLEAAQGAAAALPAPGSSGGRGVYTAVLPAIDPPIKGGIKVSGTAIAKKNDIGSRQPLASPDWQPAFPGPSHEDADGQQRLPGAHETTATVGEWSAQGWSEVKL